MWRNSYKRLHDLVTTLQHWVIVTQALTWRRYYLIVFHTPGWLSGRLCSWDKYVFSPKAQNSHPLLFTNATPSNPSGYHDPVLYSRVNRSGRLVYIRIAPENLAAVLGDDIWEYSRILISFSFLEARNACTFHEFELWLQLCGLEKN